MFQLIFFSILNGLVYGMLLFMLSSGLTLIFGMMGVLNFAHASFYMLGAYCAFTLGLAVATFGSISAILTRPRAGLITQASLTHPGMVAMLGPNVPRVFMIVFGIGSALAALAGVIAGPVLGTFPGMAQVLGSIVFVVVVIGGLGSLTRAFVASLLIGIVQTFAVAMDVSRGGALPPLGLPRNTRGA